MRPLQLQWSQVDAGSRRGLAVAHCEIVRGGGICGTGFVRPGPRRKVHTDLTRGKQRDVVRRIAVDQIVPEFVAFQMFDRADRHFCDARAAQSKLGSAIQHRCDVQRQTAGAAQCDIKVLATVEHAGIDAVHN